MKFLSINYVDIQSLKHLVFFQWKSRGYEVGQSGRFYHFVVPSPLSQGSTLPEIPEQSRAYQSSEDEKNKSMKSDDFSRLFIIFQVFSPVYKIEGHDSEDLEPLGSIKLKCIRQDGQEQLEYSGQLSIKKGWGA